MLSINPDAASREDVARLAAELMEALQRAEAAEAYAKTWKACAKRLRIHLTDYCDHWMTRAEAAEAKLAEAEARNVELAKAAVSIRTAKFSAIEDELEIVRARNARMAKAFTIRNDGQLWGFVRSVMTQAHAQQQDYMNGKHAEYEEFSAWIDRAAIEREKELIKLLNDRVCALSASDAQAGTLWRALMAEHKELGKWNDEYPVASRLRVANTYVAVEAALKGEPK